jgi:MFS family permease
LKEHIIQTSRHIPFALLFTVMVLIGMSNSMMFVILPALTRELGAGEMYVGLIFAGSSILYIFFSPFWGWWSDIIGRRPVVLIGVLGNGFFLLAMGLVAAWIVKDSLSASAALVLLALSRAIYGAFGSAVQPASQSYIADRTSRHERTVSLSLLAAGAGVGTAIGPPLAAWISHSFGVPNSMYFLVAISLILFALVAIGMPERKKPSQQTVSGSSLVSLIFDIRLRTLLIIGAIGWMGYGVFLQTLLFVLSDRLGLLVIHAIPLAGIIMAIGALGVLTVQFIIIPILSPSPRALVITGSLSTIFGSAIMVFAGSQWLIGLAFLLASAGFGAIRPGMSGAASLRVGEHEQGAAAGLLGSTAGAGFLLAPFTGLALYQFFGSSVPYLFLCGSLAIVFVMAIFQPADNESDISI